MSVLNKIFFGLALTSMSIVSANAYSAKAYQIDGQEYKIVTLFEDSTGDGRSTVWESIFNEVISYNKKTKRPEIVDISVQTHGLDDRWNYAIRINCANPTQSYVYPHGDFKNKISFKRAMALDYGHLLHIERKAVKGIFSTYC